MLATTLQPASLKVYKKAWDKFRGFSLSYYGRPGKFPLSSSDIALFVSYLDLQKYSRATVRTYVSALGYPHKLAEVSDPTATFLVKKLVDASGSLSQPLPMRVPISPQLLIRLLQALAENYSQEEALLFQAMFTFAFHVSTRIGELVISNSNRENVIRSDQVVLIKAKDRVVGFQVSFKKFKHSKPGSGAVRTVYETKDRACPVAALVTYIRARKATLGDESRLGTKSLAFFHKPRGQWLRVKEVAVVLKECLIQCGETSANITLHGFRYGGVTEAARKGASDTQLRLIGRWRSSAFLKYVRPQSFSFPM
jgi:integrase